MKVTKEELESRGWIWFKACEKRFLVNVVRAQDFLLLWRRSLQSVEFWNLSWLWTAFLMQICSLKIRFAIGEGTKKQLMSWVSSLVPEQYVAKSYPECFSDGILLCALVEKLVNGACPRYDLLDPEQPLRNLKLALHLVEKYIKIKPALTAEEIQDCKSSERSLLLLIAQMKMMSEKYNLSINSVNIKRDYMSPTTFLSEKCFARGMGLLLAVRGRRACFTILVDTIEDLDMVIEIRGPKNTGCRKRIASISAISKNDSQITQEKSGSEIQDDIPMKEMPLEYTIIGQKITVYYTPLESGTHQMSIIWQGQHIMGSPYTISVDCSVEAPDIWPSAPKRGHGRLNRTYSQCDESVTENDDSRLGSCPEPSITIKKKRVLRYIVRIDGNDVVIDGNEDLCEAINSIKRDQENLSSDTRNSLEYPDQFISNYSVSSSESPKGKSNIEIKINPPYEQNVTDDSPYFTQKMDKNAITHTQDENKEILKTDEINLSNCSDSISIDDKEIFTNNNNKNSDMTTDVEVKNNFSSSSNENFGSNIMIERDERKEEERSNAMHSKEDDNYPVLLTKESKPKRRVSFCDENIECIEIDSVLKPSNFPSNVSHLDVKDMSPQADDFFPVHKVAYEILHDDDDDDDTDDRSICSQKRRRSSFTEINEINYLDDDYVEDIVLSNNQIEAQAQSEAEMDFFPINVEVKYQKELKDYADVDKDNHQSTNHSLFECDHSLSFFTETLVETPPELAELEYDGHSGTAEEDVSNAWESKFSELNNENVKFYCEKSVELEECKTSNKRTKTGSLERSSSLTDFYDYDDAEAIDPYSFHYTDLSKLEEEEFYLSRFTNSLDLADRRKRLSWCDREPLPCIRESSIEGLLDTEIDNNTDGNAEVKEDVPYVEETRIDNQSEPENINISSSSTDSETKIDKISDSACSVKGDIEVKTETAVESNELVNNETNKISSNVSDGRDNSQIHTLSENTNKTVFSSMKIYSASPYKNRNLDNEPREFKFSPVMISEKQPSIETTDSNQPKTVLNTQSESSTFILAHAKPVLVEVSQDSTEESQKVQEMNENISDKVSSLNDSYEIKAAQSNSVKRVIEIFQKEKEEPLDTWPTEAKNCNIACCYRTLADDRSTEEKNVRNQLIQPKYCPNISIIENSCSSIRERVKLFETESQIMKSQIISGKPGSSAINAKKQYWENITS